MNYTIIIVSKTLTSIPTKIDYKIIDECEIVDNYSLNFNNATIYFDYLIFDDLNLIKNFNKIETENNYVITNYNFQTSIENFFAVGKIVRTNKSIEASINDIIEYIMDPEADIF